jgi:hypothetical protein
MVGLGPWPPRNQDAFCWFDLRSCDRSRLARAPFDVRSRLPRTLSPTANRPPLSSRGRHVKLTRQSRRGLWARVRRHREDASLQRLQPTVTTSTLSDRSVLESPPSRAFAEERSFHAACPAETLADSMIEWSLD